MSTQPRSPLFFADAPHSHPTTRPCVFKTSFAEVFCLESGLTMLMSSATFPGKFGPPGEKRTPRSKGQLPGKSKSCQVPPNSNSFSGISLYLKHPGLSRQGPDAWPILILGTPYPALSCFLRSGHTRTQGFTLTRFSEATPHFCLGASFVGPELQWPIAEP